MVINWVTIGIMAGIGLAGGILSGILASLLGRFSLNRRYKTQWAELEGKIEEKCIDQFEKMKGTVFADKRKCFECEKLIQDKAMFCANCGVPVRGAKMCDSCKIPLPDNAKFCYDCGGDAIDFKDTGKKSVTEYVLEPDPELELESETIEKEPIKESE
ncbi:MAG: zinc ribbon domain-containing protein [Asgard group archaeon]|nr:zinc ribbon domain-containing protein [Asgard group archaeon]